MTACDETLRFDGRLHPDLDPRRVADALFAGDGRALFGRGQLYVSSHGEVVADIAWGTTGDGRPITAGMRHRVYCAGKPMLVAVVAQAHELGLLGVGDRLGDHLDLRDDVLAERTLGQVLSHRGGIVERRVYEIMAHGRSERRAAALGATCELRDGARYSELLGWELVGAALEAATGRDVAELLTTAAVHPSVPTWPGPRAGADPDLGVNVLWLDERSPRPLIGERSLRSPWDGNASLGWVGSASELGAMAEAFAGTGEDHATGWDIARRLREEHTGAGWDDLLQRWCPLSGGVMTDVSTHSFGEAWGPSSFGHGGMFGASWWAADPQNGVVMACNHVDVIDGWQSVTRRRPELARRVGRVLEEWKGVR